MPRASQSCFKVSSSSQEAHEHVSTPFFFIASMQGYAWLRVVGVSWFRVAELHALKQVPGGSCKMDQ